MNPIRFADTPLLALLPLALLLVPALGLAKASDRNQPMTIDAGGQTGTLEGSGTTVLSGGVSVQQGTLDIRSERGELVMHNGEIVRVVFTGAPATMRQELEDGSPMSATANRIDYDMTTEVVTFTGSYKVSSPTGSNSGERMVYNLRTGNLQAGGDGTRVRTVIQPRRPAPVPPGGN